MNQAIEYAESPAAAALSGPSCERQMLDRAWWAVVARFLIHGLAISTWVSRIPSIKSSLHLGDGVFGMTLLGSAVGSIIGIPVCGWFVTRYGSRRACTWTSAGLCVALVLPASPSTPLHSLRRCLHSAQWQARTMLP